MKVFILLIGILFGLYAYSQTGKIKGQILNEYNYPVSNAEVIIVKDKEGKKHTYISTSTNRLGRYKLMNLQPGSYYIKVISDSRLSKDTIIKSVSVKAKKRTKLNIKLASSDIIYFIDGCRMGSSMYYPRKRIVIPKAFFIPSIFPNPSSGMLQVKSPPKTFEMTITSINGKVVYYNKSIDTHERIDLSDVSKGIYFVEFKYNDYIKYHEKLVLK